MQNNRSFWLPLYRLSWGRARRRARRTSPWTCAGTEAADARGPSFSKLAGREELTDPFQVPSLTPPLLLSGLMGRNVRLKTEAIRKKKRCHILWKDLCVFQRLILTCFVVVSTQPPQKKFETSSAGRVPELLDAEAPEKVPPFKTLRLTQLFGLVNRVYWPLLRQLSSKSKTNVNEIPACQSVRRALAAQSPNAPSSILYRGRSVVP